MAPFVGKVLGERRGHDREAHKAAETDQVLALTRFPSGLTQSQRHRAAIRRRTRFQETWMSLSSDDQSHRKAASVPECATS